MNDQSNLIAEWLADALWERYSRRVWSVDVYAPGHDIYSYPERFPVVRVRPLGGPVRWSDGSLSHNLLMVSFTVPEAKLHVSWDDLVSDKEPGYVKEQFCCSPAGSALRIESAGPSRVSRAKAGVRISTQHLRVLGFHPADGGAPSDRQTEYRTIEPSEGNAA